MRWMIPAVILATLIPTLASAQDRIGEAVYLEGDVSLVRNGDALVPESVVIGVPIENFDLMKTGDDGNAQVRIISPRVPSSTVVVSADTQFTFELSTLQGRQRSSVNLISGSLSLKVSTLSGAEDLDVQTENTVLGVRGTEFTVSTSVSGDTLVACSTGEVVCTAENGTEYQAIPGSVVENQAGGPFRRISVAAADLEGFRRTWGEQRLAAARANAQALIRLNAERYRQLREAFDRDYSELMRQRSIISKWGSEDRTGQIGRAADVDREKRTLAAAMLRLRRTQFVLERVYYRLLRLKALHDQGYGRGNLSGSLTTTQFFDQLQRERRDVEMRMATVRYVMRLYVRRNNDQDPTNDPQRFRPQRLRDRQRR